LATRSRVLIEKCFGGKQHTRGAVAALYGSNLHEGFLKGVQFISALGQAFHRSDLLALYLMRKEQTGELRYTVNQYGASTALA
jgi:hypothetical protein